MLRKNTRNIKRSWWLWGTRLLRDISKPESLKAVFPSLDNFKYLDKHYVFNVGGNELRVVAMVFFESQKCYIREVMTHKEYDFFTAVHRTKGKK